MHKQLTGMLSASMRQVEAAVNLPDNADIKKRCFRVYGLQACAYTLEGMVSAEYFQRFLLEPCMKMGNELLPAPPEVALRQLIPLNETGLASSAEEAARQLAGGSCVLLCQGMCGALCFDLRMSVRRGIAPPQTESVINGPHQGFNEMLRDNITLMRRTLPTTDLVGEMGSIGDRVPVSLCVMYLKNVVDSANLARLQSRLHEIHADHVLSLGALEQLLEDRPFSLLPQCCLTERPDRAASFLLEGQMIVLLDGSPQALCMPVSLLHLLHTPDDTSSRWMTGSFLRVIRLLGALCTLLLPGLFAAFVIYQPQAMPITLLTAVLESQVSVPLSIPLQTFFMLLMFNLIIEASTRVPGVVGSTLGTVSGLILGQAAVEAHLVHPLLIIVVAVSSLGSYAVPDYALSVALRIGQLLFLGVGCVFGVYGMVLMGALALIRACGMRSLGSPYMAPLAPGRRHNGDLLMRWPIWRQGGVTWLGAVRAQHGQKQPMRAWDRRRT